MAYLINAFESVCCRVERRRNGAVSVSRERFCFWKPSLRHLPHHRCRFRCYCAIVLLWLTPKPKLKPKQSRVHQTKTSLHIAAMLDHLEFATELLKWKPTLACELDSRKSTPLHLASANGDVEMVKLLLCANPQMCDARDGHGWNPLHVAAMKGWVCVLRELVLVKSEAACIPIDRNGSETILHVCVKHNQLEALKFLLTETLIRNNAEFMNFKDGDGNTILHLAVLDGQLLTIYFLTKIASIDVNAKNVFGLTALDLLEMRTKDASGDCLYIGRLLQHAGAVNSRSNVTPETTGAAANMMSTVAGGSTLREILKEILHEFLSKQEEWHKQQERNGQLESQRNAIMIAASLFAAAAFQAGVNPPGGFWQETVGSNNTSTESHTAGNSILADTNPINYQIIIIANAMSFSASSCICILLTTDLPLKNKLGTSILRMATLIAIGTAALSFIASTLSPGIAFRPSFLIAI
ncbi:hypothetical protein Nepgr_009071 [Nepenthes gracilis]|uniref:PGG domain-containing protein n=1 Tax=Nepenthes gracilis TaxID=150966 RepID=A0AAD3XK30_NEPGR|nr:hypothetical protein Nepgr_009071 [Nepenthes gracilis]